MLSGSAPAPAPAPDPAPAPAPPAPPPTAQADASCAGICGYQSPQGCYCDSACSGYGDCCSDYAGSCAGGGNGGGGGGGGTTGCGYGSEGDNGDSCAGVAGETWRCVWSPALDANASQVCRGGIWLTYHFDPAGCSSCCGSYSGSCE